MAGWTLSLLSTDLNILPTVAKAHVSLLQATFSLSVDRHLTTAAWFAGIPFEETWKPWPVCIFTWFIVTYPRGWDPRLHIPQPVSLLQHILKRNSRWEWACDSDVESVPVPKLTMLISESDHPHPHPRLIREMETVEDWTHRTTGTTETLSPFPSCRACSPCTLKKQTPGCSLRSSYKRGHEVISVFQDVGKYNRTMGFQHVSATRVPHFDLKQPATQRSEASC